MTASTFDVTAASVKAHHLPLLDGFSASSSPSLATVTEMVTEESARLAGALALEAIDASAITAASAAHYQCKRILRLMVAVRVIQSMTGGQPELLKAWATEIEAWLAALGEGGATFLGDGATATGDADPDGPTTHINTYGLTKDTSSSMSTVVPRLRRDDEL